MATIEALRKQIGSAEDLQSVVKTMKAMAATGIWQYEQAVSALASYNDTVELGLQIILRDRAETLVIEQPEQQHQLGVIVFGSDQGLVGRFNDVIVDFALDAINATHVKQENRRVIAVGRRVQEKLMASHRPVTDYFNMPTSLSGIEPRLSDLMQLLPIDLDWLAALQAASWPGDTLPTYDLPWQQLVSALIQEYFFVTTYRAFTESLAAENASRLASMQAAERNIEERLDDLWQQYHQLRQSSITAELLDIVSGAEAAVSQR